MFSRANISLIALVILFCMIFHIGNVSIVFLKLLFYLFFNFFLLTFSMFLFLHQKGLKCRMENDIKTQEEFEEIVKNCLNADSTESNNNSNRRKQHNNNNSKPWSNRGNNDQRHYNNNNSNNRGRWIGTHKTVN